MKNYLKISVIVLTLAGLAAAVLAAGGGAAGEVAFPASLDSYRDAHIDSITQILGHRIAQTPFNLFASLIFLCAVLHTFMSSQFLSLAHKLEEKHELRKKEGLVDRDSVSLAAGIFHLLGEVEVIFGLWVVPLAAAVFFFYDWHTFVGYLSRKVVFTEPMFVVVIMALASTRPILKLAEQMMAFLAGLIGGTLAAWWVTILAAGPILGSFITEPAAMTICAHLLADKLYEIEPSEKLKYATIGLLFVNISVGGTLTHFAAPPVLMVAGPWGLGLGHMLGNFGWKAVLGIAIATGIYYLCFRKELARLQARFQLVQSHRQIISQYVDPRMVEDELDDIKRSVNLKVGFLAELDAVFESLKSEFKGRILKDISREKAEESRIEEALERKLEDIKQHQIKKSLPGLVPEDERFTCPDPTWDQRETPVPLWVMLVHLSFLVWTVVNAHYPELFVAGFLFFLGFSQVTPQFQNRINLKPPILVGFFLGALVIHGGVQSWWIAPVLGRLAEIPLMVCATVMTAFNDNAAITYLSTLVPNFTPELKYAVLAGAVTGGGLTVIANAPNPAGQSILKRFFKSGVAPGGLFKAALLPTVIMGFCFMLLRG